MNFKHRSQVRARMENADHRIEQWEKRIRANVAPQMPPIEASSEDLSITKTAEITVSTEWLAAMLQGAYVLGQTD